MKSDFCEAKYLTALEGRESSFTPNPVDSRGSTRVRSLIPYLSGYSIPDHSLLSPIFTTKKSNRICTFFDTPSLNRLIYIVDSVWLNIALT